jgi:hypothetical protein
MSELPSSDLRSVAQRILESARETCAAANCVLVHRQLIGELREALQIGELTPEQKRESVKAMYDDLVGGSSGD